MKKVLLLLLAVLIPVSFINPCTTFVLKTKKELFFGRNLDWVSDIGMIMVNQKNVDKQSLVFPPEKSAEWTSKYGSITFNQFGKEFPFGGINEEGLIIEVLVSEAEYPEADERPVVNELQWVQYQLDNCKTVNEVIATDKVIRIGQTNELLHYLICDADGNVAAVEFIGGKMVVYKGKDLSKPVLVNDPYESSVEGCKNGEMGRFGTAADLIKKYKATDGSGLEYSFQILEQVALSAEWAIVYDVNKKQIHFSTSSIREIRMVDLANFDFSCDKHILSYDLSKNDSGDISNQFIKLTADSNTELVKDAIDANSLYVLDDQTTELIKYYKECKCKP